MEYETKGTEYHLGEFYKAYKEKLPTVVMVTQGFCGDILAETLDYGLVIRIHRIFRQRRVIAVRLNDHGTDESTYSFPVDYPVKFCLEEGMYQNEGNTLAEILDERKPPVNVQFARKQFIKIGDRMSSTSHFSTLRLTNVFDEIYLLGNLVLGYELDQQIVQIPLYLSAVEFSEVIGLKGKNTSDWKALKNKLDVAASQMDFDAFSGNPEIAKYKSNDLSKLVSKGQDLMYENFEPQTYTNVRELMASICSSELQTADNDDLQYEPVELCSSVNGKNNRKVPNSVQELVAEETKDPIQSNISHKTLFGELKARLKKGQNPDKKTDESSKPPKISPKPKVNTNASGFILQGQNCEKNLSGDTFGDSPPPLPPRLPSGQPPERVNTKTVPCYPEDSYENLKYRAEVHPMPNLQPGSTAKSSTTLNAEVSIKDGLIEIQTPNLQQVEDGSNSGTINVKVLKVDELGRWMAEKLRLGKYVERFAEELVDGATLLDLDENLLKQEFGFSPIEAKRLMKFAKEGHVPQ
ncbi:hypothetical protein CHS0354_008050 [Potamilus streckersoni]|uniref:SAM domain-containing protein n=1 Tax=Potamilus streckersoni TaxID=2493646 RepID=A0AAE0SER8_9BIVA|nr:hypothetical protein CHS0354_008050 [Potamilus streckersoni]